MMLSHATWAFWVFDKAAASFGKMGVMFHVSKWLRTLTVDQQRPAVRAAERALDEAYEIVSLARHTSLVRPIGQR
jgi:hypothetical protein